MFHSIFYVARRYAGVNCNGFYSGDCDGINA